MLSDYQVEKKVDRRRSSRWTTDKPIGWRRHHGRCIHQSKLVERSLNGMVILTSADESPPIGTAIHPSDEKMGDRHGFRLALVKRIKDLSHGSLIFTEILS